MAGIKIKSDGAWKTVEHGSIKVRWDNEWKSPSSCKIRWDGKWIDSGYFGAPNPPGPPTVNTWSNGGTGGSPYLSAKWTAAVGGAPVQNYEVNLLDAGGNPTGFAENSLDLTSPDWFVSRDTKYQFRVRSIGDTGLTSSWVLGVAGQRPGIGHGATTTPTYSYVERQKAWSTGGNYGHGNVNQLHGYVVPSNVICNKIHWQVHTPDGVSPICVWPAQNIPQSAADIAAGRPGTGYRHVEIIFNESTVWYRPNWSNPHDGYDYPLFWGNGGRTGLKPVEGKFYAWLWSGVDGAIWLFGEEFYKNYEITGSQPGLAEVPNYYW